MAESHNGVMDLLLDFLWSNLPTLYREEFQKWIPEIVHATILDKNQSELRHSSRHLSHPHSPKYFASANDVDKSQSLMGPSYINKSII